MACCMCKWLIVCSRCILFLYEYYSKIYVFVTNVSFVENWKKNYPLKNTVIWNIFKSMCLIVDTFIKKFFMAKSIENWMKISKSLNKYSFSYTYFYWSIFVRICVIVQVPREITFIVYQINTYNVSNTLY